MLNLEHNLPKDVHKRTISFIYEHPYLYAGLPVGHRKYFYTCFVFGLNFVKVIEKLKRMELITLSG